MKIFLSTLLLFCTITTLLRMQTVLSALWEMWGLEYLIMTLDIHRGDGLRRCFPQVTDRPHCCQSHQQMIHSNEKYTDLRYCRHSLHSSYLACLMQRSDRFFKLSLRIFRHIPLTQCSTNAFPFSYPFFYCLSQLGKTLGWGDITI